MLLLNEVLAGRPIEMTEKFAAWFDDNIAEIMYNAEDLIAMM